MSCKETTRMTFIEYLLESKEKKAAKKQLSEAYQTPPHNDLHFGIDLKLGVLKAALEARCFDDRSEVKLVRVSSRQIKSCRNEFGWQPGRTEAEIYAQDLNPNQPTLVSDLKNDINAMQEAGANLDQVYVKIGNFSIDGHSSQREILLGWNDHEQHPTLWVGVKTNANDLEQFVMAGGEFPAQPNDEEAAAQAPEQQALAPQQQDADNDGEEEEEDKDNYNTIHGIKFKSGDDLAVANVAQVNRMLPVIVGKWNYTDFTYKVAQTNAAEMSFFKPDEVGKCTYKQINWDDSVDSFVKRLGFIQFKKVGSAGRIDAIMQLAFNGHPAIVQFQDIGIDYPMLVLRQPCSTWYKKLVQLYLTQYKSSPRGIQVLFDRDHFFRKNSKYNIQQDPPFTIGLAVRGEANATPNAIQQVGGQAARPATAPAAPAHRAPHGAAAAEETLQQRLSQMLIQKDLNMVQTSFGVPTVKNGMRKIFGPDTGYKMLINFPGVDKATRFIGDDAVQFLDQYGIWNGMYKDVYDAVKAVHDDAQLVVRFDGDLV